ncbi:hypothetical protein OH76DRAFT_1482973 [Lentinus brumalis]|uniref:Uncharacterized protein n=1 Tax=Lentinus brumalis TaxID=2498619 RepID=A0A371DAN3_9APHY|nr:hypothetical protein OH76DRAFT_1482973 [Polyporus brumalis]
MATQRDSLPPLALTTLRSTRLFGVTTDKGGQALALDLPRARPGKPKINYQNSPYFFGIKYSAEEIPVNVPSDPLPGDVRATLDLKVGNLLWRNERHAVYDVEVLRLDPPVFHVPPLVIKLAISEAEGRGLLSEEAGMYGHIEKLQGVVAPRCYGYFSTTDETDAMWFFDPPPAPPTMMYWGIYAQRTACKGMELLLLEKVGEHLPFGKPVTQQVEDDLRDMQ